MYVIATLIFIFAKYRQYFSMTTYLHFIGKLGAGAPRALLLRRRALIIYRCATRRAPRKDESSSALHYGKLYGADIWLAFFCDDDEFIYFYIYHIVYILHSTYLLKKLLMAEVGHYLFLLKKRVVFPWGILMPVTRWFNFRIISNASYIYMMHIRYIYLRMPRWR